MHCGGFEGECKDRGGLVGKMVFQAYSREPMGRSASNRAGAACISLEQVSVLPAHSAL